MSMFKYLIILIYFVDLFKIFYGSFVVNLLLFCILFLLGREFRDIVEFGVDVLIFFEVFMVFLVFILLVYMLIKWGK